MRVSRYLKGAASPQEVMTWPMRWVNRCLAADKVEREVEEYHEVKRASGW